MKQNIYIEINIYTHRKANKKSISEHSQEKPFNFVAKLNENKINIFYI